MSAKGEKMKVYEFMGLYQIARKQLGLCMSTKKSLTDGCELKIYQNSKLIISIKDENEESMYEQATRELKHFMQRHAASSAKEGEGDGKERKNTENRNV